jgi:hypothetical protein
MLRNNAKLIALVITATLFIKTTGPELDSRLRGNDEERERRSGY